MIVSTKHIINYNFGFRINKNQNKEKRRKIENSQPIEELYEYNASKINEEKVGKTIRMLLPIKTRNGHLEKRIIEEDDKITDEEDLNDEEKSEENNKHENNDMEMDVNTISKSIKFVPIFKKC